MSKNADFSETCFSQVNDVGLSVYVVYVVTKNGIALFYWELNCFALKTEFYLEKWHYETNFVNYEISW